MITRSPIKKHKKYYELFFPKETPIPRDFHRLKRVKRWLYGNSVLDVGTGRADFLNLIKDDYQIAGVDIHKYWVGYCNQVFGWEVSKLGDVTKGLDFEDGSFDTVTGLQLLEHMEDPEETLKELVRIARKRIILTIPFNEQIPYELCVHCAKYTPQWGHLHSFNKENIASIVPDNAKIVGIELICNKVLSLFPERSSIFRLPTPISAIIDRILNSIIPKATWMMVILDKNGHN